MSDVLWISLWLVGLVEQIVDADLVELRQPNQNLVGQRLRAGLNIAVLPLRNPNGIGDVLLRVIMVLPQIFDPVAHAISLPCKNRIVKVYRFIICLLTFR